MILASAIRQVRGLGDNKFEVVTNLRTFIFRAEREGMSASFTSCSHLSTTGLLLSACQAVALTVSFPVWPYFSLSFLPQASVIIFCLTVFLSFSALTCCFLRAVFSFFHLQYLPLKDIFRVIGGSAITQSFS